MNGNAPAWSGALFAFSAWSYVDVIASMKAEPLADDRPSIRHHVPMICSGIAYIASFLVPPSYLNQDGPVAKVLFVFYWLLFLASIIVALVVSMTEFAADTVSRRSLGGGITIVLQPVFLALSTLAHLAVKPRANANGVIELAMED